MNPQPKENLKHRLQQLEAIRASFKAAQSSQSGFFASNSLLTRIPVWFNRLSGMGKLVVLGVAVLFSFAILQAVIKLIAFVISLALLILLVYLGYTFLVSSSSQSN